MPLPTRGLLLSAAIFLAVSAPSARQAQPLDLVALIDTYYQGKHDEAVTRAAALADLGPLRLRFVQDTPGWIAADPANAEKRRRAVAGFLVELTGARLESDWGRLGDLIEWTCAQVLRPGGPPTEFERSWHMATTALAGRARARVWLLGPYAPLPHQKPRKPRKDDPPSPMHLMHALDRFPDDPRFRLERIVAWTWGRDAEPIRNLRRREDGPIRLTRAPQAEVIIALDPLLVVPAVAAEALIRTGLMQVTMVNHGAALRAFEAAQPIAVQPPLKFLAHFLGGRSLEALGRLDDAAAQYKAALTILPLAESAAIALAGLQFTQNDRDKAVALMNTTFAQPSTLTDPGRLTGYGAYLHWPEIKAAMRAELAK